MLGIPAFPLLGNPFKRQVTVVIRHVVAINRTQVLTSAEGQGAREALTDAILVAVAGVVKGESGGPAVDSAGKVVGVIEGSGSGIATLTSDGANVAALRRHAIPTPGRDRAPAT